MAANDNPNDVYTAANNDSDSASHTKLSEPKDVLVLKPNAVLYTSVLVSFLLPLQYGWSTSQLNLNKFNNEDDCNADPVREGTCVMFPGHSKLEWTFAVNAWILGGMIGALSIGRFSERFGRVPSLRANCVLMVAGAVIQLAVSNVWAFAVGRLVAGLASGAASGVVSSYIGEISPPHLRSSLGVGFQISITLGILIVSLTFFFANTSSGWRYIAGFPIILAGLFVTLSPMLMVRSPVWLLNKGKEDEAKKELARLYGEENVPMAMAWLQTKLEDSEGEGADGAEPVKGNKSPPSIFSSLLIRQFLTATFLACSQQLLGINAVFYYSSDLFTSAGIEDDRIGTVIINVVNVVPTLFAGMLSSRFGNRPMVLTGFAGMLVSCIGITISLTAGVDFLSILFTALYVAFFGISMGPLVWVILPELFPNNARATAVSICVALNWLSNLIIGVAYPYVASALDDLGFLPFIILLAIFLPTAWFCVPETFGKSTDEIQEMFIGEKKDALAEA